jgi:hypothetical protein
MTLDLYGHLTDSNLWVAASRIEQDGGISLQRVGGAQSEHLPPAPQSGLGIGWGRR